MTVAMALVVWTLNVKIEWCSRQCLQEKMSVLISSSMCVKFLSKESSTLNRLLRSSHSEACVSVSFTDNPVVHKIQREDFEMIMSNCWVEVFGNRMFIPLDPPRPRSRKLLPMANSKVRKSRCVRPISHISTRIVYIRSSGRLVWFRRVQPSFTPR